MDEKNLDIFVHLDIERLLQKVTPFIEFGVTVDDDQRIDKLSEMSDIDLKNLIITLRVVENALESEYLIREQDKEKIREEIDKLIAAN